MSVVVLLCSSNIATGHFEWNEQKVVQEILDIISGMERIGGEKRGILNGFMKS